jgi:pantoate--beta-alanine ligase
MIVLQTIDELRAWRRGISSSLGLVPTMGALHEGHLSLVHASTAQNPTTVATIFVNPTQFSPGEDLAKYPRPLEADLAMLEAAGVAAVFAPNTADIYLPGSSTVVTENSLSQPMCGQFRSGHFEGVTTIVAKLFNLVQPDVAYFGQKDYQQLQVIRRMVRDLNFPVEIVMCPTVREPDGLAMSSRNRYLSPEDRQRALAINASLRAVEELYRSGERDAERLRAAGLVVLAEVGIEPQYWDVRHRDTLEALETVSDDGAVMAMAAYVDSARLIDNILVG